jgi:uncharacterized protein (DUF1778 family)
VRTTENLSLRLDPEVVRLARRSAELTRQTLREFFEEAIRRYVASVTEPEESRNLLSTMEQALLNRVDQRLKDVVERIAALSAKEALDQAHALQIMKRVLLMQINDNGKTKAAINTAWNEAVERVRSRGRPYPPEVVEGLQAKIAQWEQWATEQTDTLKQTKAALEAAQAEVSKLKKEIEQKERDAAYFLGQNEAQDFAVQREMWVSDQLEKQGMNPLGRKTAADLRRIYTERHGHKEASR